MLPHTCVMWGKVFIIPLYNCINFENVLHHKNTLEYEDSFFITALKTFRSITDFIITSFFFHLKVVRFGVFSSSL